MSAMPYASVCGSRVVQVKAGALNDVGFPKVSLPIEGVGVPKGTPWWWY